MRVVLLLCLLACFIEAGKSRKKSRVERYAPDYANTYHNYSYFVQDLMEIANDPKNADILKISSEHSSGRGEPIYVLHLTNHRTGHSTTSASGEAVDKAKVLMTFGEHARELVVVESFFDLVKNLTRGYSMPCDSHEGMFSRRVLDNLELHVIGLLNPDGKIRMERSGDECWRKNGLGVDLNRNFDWGFGGKGSSNDKRSEEYRGTHAFSEPEARLVRDLTHRHSFLGFLSMHSGEQQIFSPFVDTISSSIKRTRATTREEVELLKEMAQATHGWFKPERSGIAYELNDYSADGTLTDWIAGEAKVPYAFTVEMWGGPMHDSCFVQFNPDNDHLRHDLDQIFPIYPVALEAFAAKATHEHFSSYRLHSPEHARQAERTCRLHRGSMASGRGDQGDGMVVDGKTDSPPVYNIIVERRAHP